MRLAAIVFTALACATTGALAQESPAPIGTWMTPDGSARFLILDTGECALQTAQLYYSGQCGWDANSTGGILTLQYQTPVGPKDIYYNITWMDENTISVYGDVYHRVR